jgi:hypothetical protein
MIVHLADSVTVWMEHGVPARIVWQGRRYRVSDRPTPIRESVAVPAMTHPLDKLVGYRMQVTDEEEHSIVVDVYGTGTTARLVAVYD